MERSESRSQNYDRQKRYERRSHFDHRTKGDSPDVAPRSPLDSFRSPLRSKHHGKINEGHHRNPLRGVRRIEGNGSKESNHSGRSGRNWRFEPKEFPNLGEGTSLSSEFLTPPETKPVKRDWYERMNSEEAELESTQDSIGVFTPEKTPVPQQSWAQMATPKSGTSSKSVMRSPTRLSKRKLLLSGSSSGYSSCDNLENLRSTTSSKDYEYDPLILSRRQKQIDFGKNTEGYVQYVKEVDRTNRTREHPATPKKHVKYSRRSWDSQVKLWRQSLHKWDAKAKDTTVETISGFDFDMSDLVLDAAPDQME